MNAKGPKPDFADRPASTLTVIKPFRSELVQRHIWRDSQEVAFIPERIVSFFQVTRSRLSRVSLCLRNSRPATFHPGPELEPMLCDELTAVWPLKLVDLRGDCPVRDACSPRCCANLESPLGTTVVARAYALLHATWGSERRLEAPLGLLLFCVGTLPPKIIGTRRTLS